MENWFKQQELIIPVSGAVIFTSKRVTLRNNPFQYPFFKLDSLIERIHELSSPTIHLTNHQLSSIVNTIRLSHQPFLRPKSLVEHYGLTTSDILTGVVCPICKTCSLCREKYSWSCPQCNHKTKSGLQQAVNEYLTIGIPTITNQEFRNFFGIDSMKTATNMLTNLDLVVSGSKKKRTYMRKEE